MNHSFTFRNFEHSTSVTVDLPIERGVPKITLEAAKRIALELTRGGSDNPLDATRTFDPAASEEYRRAPQLQPMFDVTTVPATPICVVFGAEVEQMGTEYRKAAVAAWLAKPGSTCPSLVNDILDQKLELADLSIEAVKKLAYGLEYFRPWGDWAKSEPLHHYWAVFPVIREGLKALKAREAAARPVRPVQQRAARQPVIQLWEPCDRCGDEPSYATPAGCLCEQCCPLPAGVA